KADLARRAAIDVEVVVNAVVANIYIGLAVAVDIDRDEAEAEVVVHGFLAQARFLADFGECAVAVIAIQIRGNAFERLGSANVAVARRMISERPIDIMANK